MSSQFLNPMLNIEINRFADVIFFIFSFLLISQWCQHVFINFAFVSFKIS